MNRASVPIPRIGSNDAVAAWSPPAVTRDLDRDEAQRITDEIRNHATAAWMLLMRAHQGRAWKALGYETWAAYVAAEFDMSRSRSYQVLDQARVILAIEEAVSTNVDIPEAHARELKADIPAVVERAKEAVAKLPVDSTEATKREAVQDAVRPMVNLKTKKTEETTETYDAGTGEIIDPPARAFIEAAVESDQTVQDKRYVHEFYKAITKADDFLAFDAERIGSIATVDDLVTLDQFVESAAKFRDKARRAASVLRPLGGKK